MMSKRDQVKTPLAVAASRVGLRGAMTACSFAVEWAIAEASKGAPLDQVEEFAVYWRISRAQAFRRQGVYRRAFPEFATPRQLLDACGVSVDGRSKAETSTVHLAAAVLP